MIGRLLFMYRPSFSKTVVYMLQSTEYQVGDYLSWLWRAHDFRKTMYRRQLDMTKPAQALLTTDVLGTYAQILAGAILTIWAFRTGSVIGELLGSLLIMAAPLLWAHLIAVPLFLGRWLIIKPHQKRKVKQSVKIFADHQGVKIAVAGSYGKTTMKEMLKTVLSEGKKVAATEANKNVAISHAHFARRLKGDEEILIIEYGEGAPGDVTRFARVTHPTLGVITGLAPAHLDKYKTLQRAGEDIFSLASYLGGKNIYVNVESLAAGPFIQKAFILYDADHVGDWEISHQKVSLSGVSFKMTKSEKSLNIKAAMLGRHQIGPIAAVCALADRLGLSKPEIERGAAKIVPFEHRMQPYQLAGAWVLDDTYNGNIDGMKAGLELLKELPAKRKIYISPGLVNQGSEAEKIHIKLGEMIAAAGVDEVVLMKNSATKFIQRGLANFRGELKIEDDPLNFYSNLDQIVAAGDLVLMQNDWTDNYS